MLARTCKMTCASRLLPRSRIARRCSSGTRLRSFRSAGASSWSPTTAIASGSCSPSCSRWPCARERADARSGLVAQVHRVGLERSLSVERLFTFVYLLERTALDELALNDSIGATSEPWPLVAQLVRRASFDLLAAYTERAQLEPSDTAIIDKLTTLHTRPLFDAVLAKEVERAAGSAMRFR